MNQRERAEEKNSLRFSRSQKQLYGSINSATVKKLKVEKNIKHNLQQPPSIYSSPQRGLQMTSLRFKFTKGSSIDALRGHYITTINTSKHKSENNNNFAPVFIWLLVVNRHLPPFVNERNLDHSKRKSQGPKSHSKSLNFS